MGEVVITPGATRLERQASGDDGAARARLGARNKTNPQEVCVKCPVCGKKRWVNVKVYGPKRLKAERYIFRCVSDAARESQRQRAALIPDKPLSSGSIVRPSKKTIICGICGAEHENYRRPKNAELYRDKGFCADCWPWARVALRPEHEDGPSAERDVIYAKIRDIRRALEADTKRTPKGARMPFCVAAKEWNEQNEQPNPSTRDTQSYNVKLLSFHFGVMPIGDFTLEMGMEFRRFLRGLPPRRGAERGTERSELSVNQTLGVLRRVFSYACDRRWLRANPFPVGGDFTPSRRTRKPTPLVTVDEEQRLLSACTGDLAYLQEIIVSLADTGMYDNDRQRLRWADVDFDAGLIRGSGRPMRMTPRLRAAMQALWDRSGRERESLVWGSRNIKRDLGVAREVARVRGLHIKHFRPTAAWRMAQAGQGFEQIADALGCRDFNYLRQYLETDPDAAGRESNEPGFKKFLEEQFGVPANGSGGKDDPLAGFVLEMVDIACQLYDRRRQFSDVTAKAAAIQLDIRGGVGRRQMDKKLRAAGFKEWSDFAVYALKKEGRF